jgi:hypothetical protein
MGEKEIFVVGDPIDGYLFEDGSGNIRTAFKINGKTIVFTEDAVYKEVEEEEKNGMEGRTKRNT